MVVTVTYWNFIPYPSPWSVWDFQYHWLDDKSSPICDSSNLKTCKKYVKWRQRACNTVFWTHTVFKIILYFTAHVHTTTVSGTWNLAWTSIACTPSRHSHSRNADKQAHWTREIHANLPFWNMECLQFIGHQWIHWTHGTDVSHMFGNKPNHKAVHVWLWLYGEKAHTISTKRSTPPKILTSTSQEIVWGVRNESHAICIRKFDLFLPNITTCVYCFVDCLNLKFKFCWTLFHTGFAPVAQSWTSHSCSKHNRALELLEILYS